MELIFSRATETGQWETEKAKGIKKEEKTGEAKVKDDVKPELREGDIVKLEVE